MGYDDQLSFGKQLSGGLIFHKRIYRTDVHGVNSSRGCSGIMSGEIFWGLIFHEENVWRISEKLSGVSV